MEENNTKKVIDEWMDFVDDHVDNISKTKNEILSSLDTLSEKDLSKVADGLQSSQSKMKEVEKDLDEVWTTIPK